MREGEYGIRMTRKAASFLLALALLLILFPAAPARAEVEYENIGYTSYIYWSGEVYGPTCSGYYSNGTLANARQGGVAKVILKGDTTLVIPEGTTVSAYLCNIELGSYTLTITGGGTLKEYSGSGMGSYNGSLVVSGSTLEWNSGVEIGNLTVENGGAVNMYNGAAYPLIIFGSLTVNDGSITSMGYEGSDYGCGLLLDGSVMTVNDGGRVTVGNGLRSENWTGEDPCVILNGGALQADAYQDVTVAFAEGLTYLDGSGGSYTGTLSGEQLAAAADKIIAPLTAQIGTVKYSFLQEALDAASQGGSVKLLRDVTLAAGETLNVSGSPTLDLNGRTVTKRVKNDLAVFSLASGAALTVAGDGRILDRESGETATNSTLFRGAGAAESGVIFAGGTVVLGGTVTDGLLDGNAAFQSCSVTVNGGSLYARLRQNIIANGSLTVNGGAAVNFGIYQRSGECLQQTKMTVNSGCVVLRGMDSFYGTDITSHVMTINGGTVELLGSDMGIHHQANGSLRGMIILNGGAVKLSEGGNRTFERFLSFPDACPYAVEGMPDSYRGVTLDAGEMIELEGRWIAPEGVVCASGDFGNGASCVRYGDDITVFGIPADALLLTAWYDAEGRMLSTGFRSGSVDRWRDSFAFDESAAKVKLMQVDKVTFRPLCAAVELTR